MPDPRTRFTFSLADITPDKLAGIIVVLDTLYRELGNGTPLVVEHGGGPEFAEAIEDALDVSAAMYAESIAKRRGETPIPWETVRDQIDRMDDD